ncbi:response regulator [Paenibacillus sp. J5C_2022]|uniref:hybrid sensor histidine kinase/response regulator n=1 Tax=Paenibacillus sp. J5C2022 TaxID=2977129 RepID=UPI0021D25E0B|nr:response regulator [Paenibacillus sp. J5C2022]MCU6709617.1 response regulator [Paenibacillus sp. J5C2022]
MLTELKDMKYALSALEASSIISITDDRGNILYVNELFCEISQYDKTELIGQPHSIVSAAFHPHELFQQMWRTIGEGRVWKGELKNKAKDGSVYWVNVTIVPFVNDAGIIYQHVAFGTDITARKENESKLHHTMENLNDIENALDESSIVAITDDKGVITYVNDKFCEISKYGREELLGKTHRVINSGYHPKTFFKTMWDTIRSGNVWRGEVKNRAKDGSEYWMNTTIVPFLDEKGKPHHFISIRTDITDRVRAEAALAERTKQLGRARDEAIKANMIKSQFLANMSHELRTPLNAIIGYSEMLMEDAAELSDPAFAEDLAKIGHAGRHLLALINDILDISKIEAGKMEVFYEPCSLHSLVEDVEATIAPLALQNGNKLILHPIDGEIWTDITKMRQILLNLLSNANKFTKGGEVELKIEPEDRTGQDGYSFKVKDSGIGMTSEQLSKLFRPFFQGDSSTTRQFGGTGLGLAISRSFCELLGGDIAVESEPEAGSLFTCWLPAKPRQNMKERIWEHGDIDIAVQGDESVRILLIDDEPSNEQLLRHYLSSEGWQLSFADSGEEGLRLSRELQPHVILLDILMPAMDGWSVLSRLKTDPVLSGIPVIIVSMTDDKKQGFSLGASEFITKPVDRAQLVATIDRYIPNRNAQRVLVIEDDATTNEMMAKLLQKEGYQVSQSYNGRNAIAYMQTEVPGLILLDLMMPEMDGFQFLAELRKRDAWRTIPVIVITAKTITVQERLRLNGYVKGVMQKGSFDHKSLLAEIHQLIGE